MLNHSVCNAPQFLLNQRFAFFVPLRDEWKNERAVPLVRTSWRESCSSCVYFSFTSTVLRQSNFHDLQNCLQLISKNIFSLSTIYFFSEMFWKNYTDDDLGILYTHFSLCAVKIRFQTRLLQIHIISHRS